MRIIGEGGSLEEEMRRGGSEMEDDVLLVA